VKRWSIRFKDRKPGEGELTFIAQSYFIDLVDEKVTVQELAYAEREVNKRNRFFPVMADILEAVREHRNNRAVTRSTRDIEWKRNFPELLTKDERILLRVPESSIRAAVTAGELRQSDLDYHLKNTLKMIDNC
jgi:hypothetical protein